MLNFIKENFLNQKSPSFNVKILLSYDSLILEFINFRVNKNKQFSKIKLNFFY
jgi:hypothetical protein